MYQPTMQQLFEELPLHILVFLCGAFGYVATRWVNRRYWPRRPSQTHKSFEEDAVDQTLEEIWEENAVLASVEEHLSQEEDAAPAAQTHTSCEAACAEGVEKDLGAHATVAEALSKEASVELPKTVADGVPEDAVPISLQSSPQDEGAMLEFRVAAQEEDVVACVSAQVSREEIAEDIAQVSQEDTAVRKTAEVSDRVARLMAKKAERKARKMQESMEQVPTAQAKSVCLACIPECGEGEEHSFHSKHDVAAACTSLVSKVDPAELSTADEGQYSSWDAMDDDSSEDEGECWGGFDDHQDHPEPCIPRFEVRAQTFDNWALPMSELQQPKQSFLPQDDGWMLPFDELMHRRTCSRESMASPFVQESFGGGDMQFVDEGATFEPVLSADGKQLYTDGVQFFVMSEQTAQLEPPMWNPHNPMHACLMDDGSWDTCWS